MEAIKTTATTDALKYVKGQYEALFKLDGWAAFDTEEARIYRDIMQHCMADGEYAAHMHDIYAKYHE